MIYLLTLALGLRLVLFNQSLWLDESIEALALMGRMGPLLQYALADFQPPLYHLLGYVTTQFLGHSEIILRLPSLISGLLTVYFVVKIGRLLGTPKTGTIVGLLAATNPLLIYYSQEGRTYALTTFLVTASFYYFIQLLQVKKRSHYILYSLFTVLFLWTSYLSWFVLLAQAGYTLYKKRYDLFSLQIVSSLTLLVWLPSFLTSLGIGNSTISTSPQWGRVVGGLSWKSLPLTWVKFVIGRISLDAKLVYGLLVATVGLLHLSILSSLKFKRYLILLVWLVPPVVLGLLTAGILPVYQYFRVLFVLPSYLLLLSLALTPRHTWRLPILAIMIQLVALGYFWLTPAHHKEDWRQVVADLPSSASVAMPSDAQSAPLRYYGYQGDIIEPSRDELSGETIYYIRYVEDLFDTSRQGQANFSESGYTITSQKVYSGIQVDIYENRD